MLNQLSNGIKPHTNMLVHAPAMFNADFKESDYNAYYKLREKASTGQLTQQQLADLVIDRHLAGENCDPALAKKG